MLACPPTSAERAAGGAAVKAKRYVYAQITAPSPLQRNASLWWQAARSAGIAVVGIALRRDLIGYWGVLGLFVAASSSASRSFKLFDSGENDSAFSSTSRAFAKFPVFL
jgi:hypothetical protein